MQFNGNFIGYPANTSMKFCSSDREQLYYKNLKEQPPDWYYRSNKISYDYNQFGHRSKNIEDIDLTNYILFTGCSHTLGIGLELEKTYPHLVSSELQCDYYNLALGGSGIDTMTYNLVIWLNYVKIPPKILIIQWPHEVRFLTTGHEDLVNFHLPLRSFSEIINYDIPKFMVSGDNIGYFTSREKLSSRLIGTCYTESDIINIRNSDLIGLDHARDMMHCGIISNNFLAKKILDKLS